VGALGWALAKDGGERLVQRAHRIEPIDDRDVMGL
jgi:hypothetical protein